MAECLLVGKSSQYVPGQLSLPSFPGRLIKCRPMVPSGEIWQNCSSSKYALIDGVGFLIIMTLQF